MNFFSEKCGALSILRMIVAIVIYPARHFSACYFILTVGMLFFWGGCSDDSSYKVVNLSQKQMKANPGSDDLNSKTLRVAVAAMISPKETFASYPLLLDYIGKRLDRDVKLIQRRTYSEINDLFLSKEIDLAFICSGPYANGKDRYGFDALVTPVVRGEPFYHSYLIVNINSRYNKLEDLMGHVFAFTDPDSNTGALVPKYWLRQIGEQSDSFFNKVIYTSSHDNSILAVAKGLVDGAAVDGHIWEFFAINNPVYTSLTKVIRKSKPFGSPPLVAGSHIPNHLKQRIHNLMVQMHEDPEGMRILSKLMIDRFSTSEEEWYQPIRDIYQCVHPVEKDKNEAKKS